MINHQAFPFQQDVQPRTTKSFPLLRQLPQAVTQGVIGTRLRLVTVDRRRDVNQLTGPSFAQPKALPDMGDR